MAEKRLIDADAILKKAKPMEELDGDGIPYEVMAVSVILIDDAPTVDAVEVVHGYTIPAEEPKTVYLDRKCGICDQLMLSTDVFCPMCGARMDLEV